MIDEQASWRTSDFARYYPVARSAHLERLPEMYPADFIFTSTRDDWDQDLAASTPGVMRLGFPSVLRRLWRGSYRIVEIPEPLAVKVLPNLLAISLVVKLRRWLSRGRRSTELVFYAIENFDQVAKFRSVFPFPKPFVRSLVNCALAIVLSETSRVVFGTIGALNNYRSQMGMRGWARAQVGTQMRVILGLSSPSREVSVKQPGLVCFLGAFEERKGIALVISSWEAIHDALPDARLVMVGRGAYSPAVREFAAGRHEVRVVEDPSRGQIRSILSAAECLLLPSQRTPVWREQIGLAILEALSAGCEIVTTSETGIADWLAVHGHRVLDSGVTSEGISDAVIAVLASVREPSVIRSDLPALDGRIAADHWLFHQAEVAHGSL